MSLDALVSNSYTVEQTKSFAARFSRCESKLEKAVMAVAMLVIGPAALAALILADAFRGGAYIAEGLYNWNDKKVTLGGDIELPLIKAPGEEILAEAEQLNVDASNQHSISQDTAISLDQRRQALAERVAEHVSTIDSSENQVAFVDEVLEAMGPSAEPSNLEQMFLRIESGKDSRDLKDSKIAGFKDYFVLAASDVMRKAFFTDIRESLRKAFARLNEMNKTLHEVCPEIQLEVFSECDVDGIQGMFNSNISEHLEDKEMLRQLDEALGVLESVGLPNSIDVLSIRDEIIDSKIELIQGQNAEIRCNLDSTQSERTEVKAIEAERDLLIEKMRGLRDQMTELRGKLIETRFDFNQTISSSDSDAEKKIAEIEKDVTLRLKRAKEGVGTSKELKTKEDELEKDVSEFKTNENKLAGRSSSALMSKVYELTDQMRKNQSEIERLTGIKQGDLSFLNPASEGRDEEEGAGISDSDDDFPVGGSSVSERNERESMSLDEEIYSTPKSEDEPKALNVGIFSTSDIEVEEEVNNETPERKSTSYPSFGEVLGSLTNAFNGIDA